MRSALFRVPGRPRLRPLRGALPAAPDCGAAQWLETVLFPPRWTVLSSSRAAAAQTCGYTAPFADSTFLRYHRQYRRAVKREATCPWYRRGHLAIRAWPQQTGANGTRFGISSICFFFMGLTPPPRRTYSASWQDFLPISAGAFPPHSTADSAKIEDRYYEMAKGTFGERLKRERELREVSLNEIAM